MFDNTLRQNKLIVYRLKRNYGVSIVYTRITSVVNNVETGAITPTLQEISIRRAIIGPALILRDFVYDLSFIAANKNFTYGGYFDTGTRALIVDSKDLPSGFAPNLDDYIVYDDEKYAFKEVAPLAKKYAWAMTLKQVASIPVPS